MTTTESIHELFAPGPRPRRDLIWYGDQLLVVAQHADYLLVENRRVEDSPGDRELVAQVGSPSADVVPLVQDYKRMFRPLLARLAKLGSDETGADVNPYGDQFDLTRSSGPGAIRLHVEFQNTPAQQWVRFTRTVTERHPVGTNGTHAVPQPAIS